MDELYHYGVKGMKWGKRRALSQSAKYAKKIKRGSNHAIAGLAFENSGYKKLANRYYKKADKQEQKWAAKKQKADDTAKNYSTPEAQAARKAKIKKAAKIGAAAAGAALAVYGGYKLSKIAKNKKQPALDLKSLGLETFEFDRFYPETVEFDRFYPETVS